MSQRWEAIGKSVSDFTARDLNLKPSALEMKALPFDQVAITIALIFKSSLHLVLQSYFDYLIKNNVAKILKNSCRTYFASISFEIT